MNRLKYTTELLKLALTTLAIFHLWACSDISDQERSAALHKSQRPWVAHTFSQNHPMTDAFYHDVSALTESGVQAFLEHTPYGRSWLADYQVSGRRVSQMIYQISQSRGLNPILLLSRMQVEASLISAKRRPAQHLIDRAMGCGCPDGYACAARYLGLHNQINCAAQKFRELYDKSVNGSGWWRKGLGKSTLDNYWIVPNSHATAALYAYTPWVLQGSGGTWLAWKTAMLFDTHAYEEKIDLIGREGSVNHGSSESSGGTCGQFFDLPSDHPGFGSVEAAADQGWVSGCGSDNFCPEGTLTRAQAASVIRDAFLVGQGRRAAFEDVRDHWAQDAIGAVISAGLMSGCSDTSFCPEDQLTRAQAASVIARAAQVSGVDRSVFRDIPSDHWAASAVASLYAQGDIGGCSTTEFCPDAPMRRWIFVTWIINVKKTPKVSCH